MGTQLLPEIKLKVLVVFVKHHQVRFVKMRFD